MRHQCPELDQEHIFSHIPVGKGNNALQTWGQHVTTPCEGKDPGWSTSGMGWISSTPITFSIWGDSAPSTAVFHGSSCFLLQQSQSSTRSCRCWLSGWNVPVLQECITHLQTRWWSSWILILPPLWMRNVQGLQKQVPPAEKKNIYILSVTKMENSCILGFTQLSVLSFPTPWGLFGHGSKISFENQCKDSWNSLGLK